MFDPALITSAQRGDADAFASLVDQLRGLVTGLCFSEMGDWDAAEDCAQEVFVRMYHRLKSLRDPARFPAWLRTVVRNVCMSELRRPHRRRSQSLEATERDFDSPVGAPEMRKALDRKALLRRLTELVTELPPTQRRVLVLRHFEELDINSIAELTDLTPASVRTMLCRARVSLRGLIEKDEPELRTLIQ
jgi:RNA polymerase sigma-70 factor (ECF subfamily)